MSISASWVVTVFCVPLTRLCPLDTHVSVTTQSDVRKFQRLRKLEVVWSMNVFTERWLNFFALTTKSQTSASDSNNLFRQDYVKTCKIYPEPISSTHFGGFMAAYLSDHNVRSTSWVHLEWKRKLATMKSIVEELLQPFTLLFVSTTCVIRVLFSKWGIFIIGDSYWWRCDKRENMNFRPATVKMLRT